MVKLKKRGMEAVGLFLILIGFVILALVLSSLFFAARPQQTGLVDIMHDSQNCPNSFPVLLSDCAVSAHATQFSLNCIACHQNQLMIQLYSQPWLPILTCGNETCHGASRRLVASRIWVTHFHE